MKDRRAILSDISKDNTLSLFDKRVYRAVVSIPPGQVRSYGWVARKIGSPRASRAVGNALNRNPYAPDVPCHRVVRSDSSIGGFARGSEAKARLLRLEGIDVRGRRLL